MCMNDYNLMYPDCFCQSVVLEIDTSKIEIVCSALEVKGYRQFLVAYWNLSS
jgi:hypothetical protein